MIPNVRRHHHTLSNSHRRQSNFSGFNPSKLQDSSDTFQIKRWTLKHVNTKFTPFVSLQWLISVVECTAITIGLTQVLIFLRTSLTTESFISINDATVPHYRFTFQSAKYTVLQFWHFRWTHCKRREKATEVA